MTRVATAAEKLVFGADVKFDENGHPIETGIGATDHRTRMAQAAAVKAAADHLAIAEAALAELPNLKSELALALDRATKAEAALAEALKPQPAPQEAAHG